MACCGGLNAQRPSAVQVLFGTVSNSTLNGELCHAIARETGFRARQRRRWISCLVPRSTCWLQSRKGNVNMQVDQFVGAANKVLEGPSRALDAALHGPHLEAAAAAVGQVASALGSASLLLEPHDSACRSWPHLEAVAGRCYRSCLTCCLRHLCLPNEQTEITQTASQAFSRLNCVGAERQMQAGRNAWADADRPAAAAATRPAHAATHNPQMPSHLLADHLFGQSGSGRRQAIRGRRRGRHRRRRSCRPASENGLRTWWTSPCRTSSRVGLDASLNRRVLLLAFHGLWHRTSHKAHRQCDG